VISELENGLVSDGIEEVLTVNQTLEPLLNDVEKRVEGSEGGICAVIHDRPSIRRGKRQPATDTTVWRARL
jgi:hypothetical protein